MRGGVETIEGIPVQWVAPGAPQGVALWLTTSAVPPSRPR